MFIGLKTKLRYLDLSENSFGGTIPKFIGSMSQLRHLDLGLNNFTGLIPSELGNLTNLHVLSLRNLRECTIENLDWLSHLSRLEDLLMDGISLAKTDNWVNVILSLHKLSSLSLRECELARVMHPHFSSSVNSSAFIVSLTLRDNNLNSSMFQWLSPLTSNRLVYLDLSGNKLDGIPKYFRYLCSLSSLYFHNNSMQVKLHNFLNNLSGCTSITLLTLYASSSQFSGSLSDDIRKFSSLEELDLSHNQLNGTISEKVWKLPNLGYLNLSSNSLKGVISKKIRSSKVITIDLSNNSLDEVSSLPYLSKFSNVENIILSSNNIYGNIPNIPSTVIRLDLSKNKFYGRISFLCQMVDGPLVFLDLSNNKLRGQIPDCLWQFKNLQVLNLGYNKLYGRPPASIGSLVSLREMYLNNNNFHGKFPLSLKNCTNLGSLYLGANKFSGNVPFWIGKKLSSLYALSLTSNNFYGGIPLELCQLVELRILDLSINNLNGTIPTCLNKITAMVRDSPYVLQHATLYGSNATNELIMIHWKGYLRDFSDISLSLLKIIDLSKNNLTGKIPDELADLHALVELNFSMNALYGKIPSKIGHMKQLQSLDLSRNNLSREIPLSMSQINFLSYLDLSYNNLLWKIPSSTQDCVGFP